MDGVDATGRVAAHVASAMLRAEAETSVVYPPGRWVVAVRRLLQGTAVLLVVEAVFSFGRGAVHGWLVAAVVLVLLALLLGSLTWARAVRAEPVWPQRRRSLGTVVAVGGLLVAAGALVLGPTVLRTSLAPDRLEAVVLGVGAGLVVLFAAEPLRWSRPLRMPMTSWPAAAEEYAVLSTAAQAAYLERDWLLECARLAPMTGGPVVDRLVADGWLRAGRGSRGARRIVRLLPSGRRRHQQERAELLAATAPTTGS